MGLHFTCCEARVSTDKEHLSLPHLYGAPAQTPRRTVANHIDPPVGPDDLPIENFRSVEDQALALQLFPRAYTAQATEAGMRRRPTALPTRAQPELRGRPLLLRALAGRLMRPKGH